MSYYTPEDIQQAKQMDKPENEIVDGERSEEDSIPMPDHSIDR